MLSLSKPLQEFSKLDKCLSKHGTRFKFVNDKEIICSPDESNTYTFVILEGVVSLIRGDKVLIGIVQAPFIFGLADGVAKKEAQYKLIAESGCIGYRLSSSQTLAIIEQNQLWREAFCWLAWKSQVLELRDRQLIGNNSYDQIRATLITMIEWDEELRSRIGVMNYIHQRTRVSRSVVAEVLAALRKGNYIEMNKGKLISINRLPSEY
ncbi:TPA_asm: hydrogen peroxide resistance inhibitor IprA [Salmonella enterica subsp. salamae serovar 60:g,m,t:z6]|uniref:Inhibitor of hydrogen peroxide resistance n=1 Tax=Salmonella enterica subsp. houtenae serovar 1,40:z4,z32:- TaxID=1967604 RepID=A0A730WA15_SALHO|nr:hydrogen peroxide resistance inhibitor IprA [Salmonella enterica]HAC6699867.1 hydrogen peroxide resistance inhibitor IprA [Salmonella bongori serovar 66:z65:-]HAE2268761.1 hydrogen peroxide resistance inhibitor IprA [Salmonella enterica subsp. enterica serovar 1,9,12:-:-]HAE4190110.1 hydrogen peroxide resistance inhibitor IprA [Salmonella enterica subsp. houtenae serovar 1,40:z4,z32:-]HAE7514470.1 hydrogen peroxide resistance inhibitor IprA [Salmonella enterica subsp. salamae serovar 60:g,m,